MADKKLSRIIDLHAKLARRVKEYEQAVDSFPPTEVLNELRYALRAVLELWEINNQAKFDQQAFDHAEERANHALLCAYHDLVDGVVMDLATIMKKMIEEYPEASYDVLGSSRVEILDLINEVEEKVAESREKLLDRKKIYEEQLYDRWYASLLKYRKQMTRTTIPEIVDRHKLLEEKRKKSKARDRFMIAIGIIGVLLSIVGIVLTVAALT